MQLAKRTLIEKKQNIVILDDDKQLLSYLKQVFDAAFPERTLKYFSKASNEFYDHINDNCIDLFVMDILLKGKKDGIEISENIISSKQGTIFLFISGFDYTRESFEHLSGKCVYDFLKKPISKDELIIVISTLLNVAATYKESCKPQIRKKQKQTKPEMDDLRNHYMKLLEEDKLLIKRLQSAASI